MPASRRGLNEIVRGRVRPACPAFRQAVAEIAPGNQPKRRQTYLRYLIQNSLLGVIRGWFALFFPVELVLIAL
jgi:hypothetical protein